MKELKPIELVVLVWKKNKKPYIYISFCLPNKLETRLRKIKNNNK